MPRLWAKNATYASISVGDDLPVVVKWETEESIARYRSQAASSGVAPSPEEARYDTDETTLPLATLRAYVVELLEKGFPPPAITGPESRLEVNQIRPVRAGDTISLTGQVLKKWEESGTRLVECRIVIENHQGEPVAEATAVLSFGQELPE